MCGLVGVIDIRESRAIERTLIERMNDSQHHRGPDETGIHLEPGLALGHKRLSIIDLSSGQQPMYNDQRDMVLVYNGEIYNFQLLRAELEASGHVFRTHSDTEVILRGYEQWGNGVVDRLRGMFVFALWNGRKQTLLLARDRLGIKPLYYAQLPSGFVVFASELKGVLAHPQFQREIDPTAVEDYFAFGYVPDPKSIFKCARKLSPGFTLEIGRGRALGSPRQYWDVSFDQTDAMDEHEVGAELISRLNEAVRIRMIAEVPLGAFLSGGVDSSAVVAMMARESPDPVNTCSISFGDPAFNESRYAAAVAQRYGTQHRVEQVDPDDFALLDTLAGMYDEPFADSSAIPTYRVCELARRQVTVALSGDGGDENLAGYRRYKWHMNEELVRARMPDGLRTTIFGTLGRFYPKADWAPKVFRAKSTLEAIGRGSAEGYLHSVGVVSGEHRRALFTDALKHELQGYNAMNVFTEHLQRAPTDDALAKVQYLDLKTYLPGDILTKVDRASMAHSLEVRVPLLDHEFVEWMARLPSSLKLRAGEGKYVLKKALEPHLTRDILYRAKMGFGVPISKWFRGPLKASLREALLESEMARNGQFDQRYVQKLIDQHQRGVNDHGPILWSLLMFEGFHRKVLEQ